MLEGDAYMLWIFRLPDCLASYFDLQGLKMPKIINWGTEGKNLKQYPVPGSDERSKRGFYLLSNPVRILLCFFLIIIS